MNEYYLHTINLRGLHFKKRNAGGAWCAPLPFSVPAGSVNDSYDKDTLVLSYDAPIVVDGESAGFSSESYSFTEEELTEAMKSSCPTDN